MKKSTYKKYLKFAGLSRRAYDLDHQIVKELKKEYGAGVIEEYLSSSSILQDAGVYGETVNYEAFVEDIKISIERQRLQKECEDRDREKKN